MFENAYISFAWQTEQTQPGQLWPREYVSAEWMLILAACEAQRCTYACIRPHYYRTDLLTTHWLTIMHKYAKESEAVVWSALVFLHCVLPSAAELKNQ
jgi:hypothetical protein